MSTSFHINKNYHKEILGSYSFPGCHSLFAWWTINAINTLTSSYVKSSYSTFNGKCSCILQSIIKSVNQSQKDLFLIIPGLNPIWDTKCSLLPISFHQIPLLFKSLQLFNYNYTTQPHHVTSLCNFTISLYVHFKSPLLIQQIISILQ